MTGIYVEIALLAVTVVLATAGLLTIHQVWRRGQRREQRAIANLETTARRLHDLLTQSNQAAFAVDREGIVRWADGEAVSGLDLRAGRAGRHYDEVFADWPDVLPAISSGLQGQRYEERILDRGSPFDLSLRPSFGPNGRVIELFGVLSDTSEAAYETERAERLAQFRSGFLSEINFRLRTPLSGIVGVTELLEHAALGVEEREWVNVIQESNKTLLGFINDLIDFGELDAGRLTLESHPFDLRRTVESLADEYLPAANDRGITLIVRYPRDVADQFNGDAERVHQILSNLIANGIEATERGHVLVEVRESARQITDTRITISVEDTGPSIPTSDLPHLFDGFGRAAMSTGGQQRGTGLGLAISSRLAQLMGGHLTVTGRAGEGSRFEMEFKLSRAVASLPEPAPANRGVSTAAAQGARADMAGRRALLAEDSLVQRKVVEQMLRSMGFEVSIARNGVEAVQAIEAGRFDIVFMDCQMPELDGFDATREIRARTDVQATVPIVAMTADAMPGDRERCLAAGMNDYLSKPVTIDEIQETALRWVPSEFGTPNAPGDIDADVIAVAELRKLEQAETGLGHGPSGLVSDFAEAFLASSPGQLIGTRDAVIAGDPAAVALSLKPYQTSCHLLGAGRSASLCDELFDDARTGDFIAAELKLRQIERSFVAIQAEAIAMLEDDRTDAELMSESDEEPGPWAR